MDNLDNLGAIVILVILFVVPILVFIFRYIKYYIFTYIFLDTFNINKPRWKIALVATIFGHERVV